MLSLAKMKPTAKRERERERERENAHTHTHLRNFNSIIKKIKNKKKMKRNLRPKQYLEDT